MLNFYRQNMIHRKFFFVVITPTWRTKKVTQHVSGEQDKRRTGLLSVVHISVNLSNWTELYQDPDPLQHSSFQLVRRCKRLFRIYAATGAHSSIISALPLSSATVHVVNLII